MSADADFTLTTAALLQAADAYYACATFHVERDGSRHFCTTCQETELVHIIVALRTAYRTVVQAVTAPSDFPNENDWDEKHRHAQIRFRPKMTREEHLQGLADRGVDTLEDYEETK